MTYLWIALAVIAVIIAAIAWYIVGTEKTPEEWEADRKNMRHDARWP